MIRKRFSDKIEFPTSKAQCCTLIMLNTYLFRPGASMKFKQLSLIRESLMTLNAEAVSRIESGFAIPVGYSQKCPPPHSNHCSGACTTSASITGQYTEKACTPKSDACVPENQ
jgi:hypothetical protein